MSVGDAAISKATRRILFKDVQAVQHIPGAGSSAAREPRRHVKTKITINIDGDVLEQVRSQAETEGVRYQTLINQILREHLAGSRPERLAKDVAEVLTTDKGFIGQLKALIETGATPVKQKS